MRFSAPSKVKSSKLKVQSFLFLLFIFSPASAQAPNPYTVPNTNPDVPKNLHTWTQNVMIEVMSAMSCQLSGIDPTNPKTQCLGVDQKTGKIGYVEGGGGAIGVAGKMIAMLYTPPLHTGDYFKYLASNFGIVKSAHAQAAAGFEGLQPIQSLWVAFRNVVYLLFVIIFIVIGLAIMLRVRIDPRTVMTIQNQIPKIIIGILLVTFSFAIAGFLIDLMYVTIFLSYELISGALPAGTVSGLNPLSLQGATPFAAASGIGGIFGIAHNAANSAKDVIQSLLGISSCSGPGCFAGIYNPFAIFWENTSYQQSGHIIDLFIDIISYAVGVGMFNAVASLNTPDFDFRLIGDLLDLIVSGAQYATAFAAGFAAFSGTEFGLRELIPYLIIYIIVLIALLFALIRLWFSLIIAYLSILIDVVFAPFWIAATLLPGSSIGFGAWLRSIIANLAAFPATIIMFLLAKAFIDGFGSTQTSNQFVPPLIGNPGTTDAIGSLIGLGIILMTHNVVHLVKAALKAPTTPFGAIGAAIGVGTGVIGSPVGIVGHIATSGFGYALSERIRGSRLPFVGKGRGAGAGGAGAGPI